MYKLKCFATCDIARSVQATYIRIILKWSSNNLRFSAILSLVLGLTSHYYLTPDPLLLVYRTQMGHPFHNRSGLKFGQGPIRIWPYGKSLTPDPTGFDFKLCASWIRVQVSYNPYALNLRTHMSKLRPNV